MTKINLRKIRLSRRGSTILAVVLILSLALTFQFYGTKQARAVPIVVTVPTDYPFIQDAIDAVNANPDKGDVNVLAGTYNEVITLYDGVNLYGAGSATTFINGNGVTQTITAADNLTISGFSITGGTEGIRVDGVSPTIEDCDINNNSAAGLNLLNGANPTIQNNTIDANGFGVNISLSTGTITGNTISNSGGYGLQAGGPTRPVISGNTITNSGTAAPANSVQLSQSDAIIHDNTITGGAGSLDGIEISASSANALIYENTITNHNSAATGQIEINSSSTPYIIDNTIGSIPTSELVGILVTDAQPIITGNLINIEEGTGIHIKHNNANPSLFSNTVTSSLSANILFDVTTTSKAILSDNEISSSSTEGIFIQNLDILGITTIFGNNIHDNAGSGVNVYAGSATSLVINHNLITDNGADGIDVATGQNAAVYNNTIVGNGGDGFEENSPNISNLYNNIITGNSVGIVGNAFLAPGPSYNYNDVWNNGTDYVNAQAGTGAISSDPLYLSSVGQTPLYSLQFGSQPYPNGTAPYGGDSPAVDVADPASPDDLRPPGRGSRAADMGAYGSDTTKSSAPQAISVNGTVINAGDTVNGNVAAPVIEAFTGTAYNDAGNIIRVRQENGGNALGQDSDLEFYYDPANPGDPLNTFSRGSVTTSALTDGSHNLEVVVVNKLGIASDPFSFTYNLQTTTPTSSISEAGGLPQYTNTAVFDISYIASASTATIQLWYRREGGAFAQYNGDFDPTTDNPISFDSSTTGGDGLYEFYTIACDAALNCESAKLPPYVHTIVDTQAPTSSVTALPQFQANNSFTVAWTGDDGASPPTRSGIASYDIQFKDGDAGPWTDWLGGTTSNASVFTGTEGHTYYFQSRARDNAGNVEPYPGGSGDTSTTINPAGVDTIPPADITDLSITDFSQGSVTLGWTAPGDSGNVGTAASYDIRTNLGYITNANWDTSDSVPNPVKPSIAGSTEAMSLKVYANGLVGAFTDADNDSLSDYWEEIVLGSNPLSADSDGDGYSDATERHYGFPLLDPAPAKIDQDYDGIIDEKEAFLYNTDPFNPDTDGDGYSDFIEVDNKYSPLDPSPQARWDEDGDGLTNYEEVYMFHTNGNNPDTDSDGYNDFIETESRHYNPVNVFFFAIKTTDPAGNVSGLSNIANQVVIY